jgi:Spy/CpxP family protein refolding chaperone
MKWAPHRPRSLRHVCLAALAMSVSGLMFAPAVRSQQAEPKKPVANAPAAQEAAPKAPRRLPQYFNRVVTPAQRQQIYGIQAKYLPEIEALEAQLKAALEKRDAEIEAVLTPEQRETLANIRAEAAAKKQPAAAPTAQAPPAPPVTAKQAAN